MRMIKYKGEVYRCPKCANYYWFLALENNAIVCTSCEYIHPADIEITIPHDQECNPHTLDKVPEGRFETFATIHKRILKRS